MKISKLHIDQFRHLENLKFDFTYPEDFHIEEKRGKPLDKICFIGQSASGKTSLLELIKETISQFYDSRIISKNKILTPLDFNHYNIELDFEADSIIYKHKKELIEIDNKKFNFHQGNYNGGSEDVINYKNKLFYFTAEILSKQNIKLFEEETVILIERYKTLKEKIKNNSYFRLTFDDKVEDAIWIGLLEENINYLQKFLQFASELINSGKMLDSTSQKKVENWKDNNINPLIEFSKKFNSILEKINLEVDLVNTRNITPLHNKISGENIPIQNTSTGTKQLLLTALLLFKLDTKDSIILIDEPERSLFPDIQMELMNYYKKIAPKAQFIVATHSPFIAASFEPEERFILYFDLNGKVQVRLGKSPIGDDPNDMLYNDFGINYINKYGQEKYEEYLNLKQKVFFEKDENVKQKYAEELEKLGEEYNF
ncbi:AAA15 family ATPase/GTPase [Flavobacterium arsenatis]|uniref:AAA15 family ATPase/GTPase n=1 Tax=Flavobacterium arsenatis TaxID=1484332 RepID=A0ABU1TJW6_9FLAO|nr:AAA family ATPase [Flavobacterium arsenatis]MDR6966274.1 AAA15 family ATPase/GTPase [Flavobacterium arsenatis]